MPARVAGWIRHARIWLAKTKANWLMWSLTMGPVLLVAGWLSLGQGIYYTWAAMEVPQVEATTPIEQLLGLGWWGVVRISLGVVALLASIRPRQPVAALAIGGLVFVNCLWGVSHMVDFMTGAPALEWRLGLPYFGLAALILWGTWITGKVVTRLDVGEPESR